ncbi:MAG: hypothetical protein ACI80V_000049 [Rhodothermales bacterium]
MNRLQDAKSPYLLQHRHNPVDWFPWGPEAFEEARRRDVPIFLSIGYATCHWCHVMERESFEDDEVAKVMNQHLVSIKVDREERPDIDDVYMTVCHLMGNQGGWPLTVLMTPDKQPFYTATYLPKETRFGRIGMLDLVPRVSDLWKERRDEIVESAAGITARLRGDLSDAPRQADAGGDTAQDGGSGGVQAKWLDEADRGLRSRYDATYGGFGKAPKFPSPHNLSYLFKRSSVTTNQHLAEMASHTIRVMWRGGVFDQLGYGFHRYSTDSEWRLPHFEKMLHDQATMLAACVDGYLATGDETLREVGLQIAEYVLRDLTHPDGGFFSAEDADSEGEEGRFYVWTEAELSERLTAADSAAAAKWFGVTEAGNFEDEATREKTGANVLHPGLNPYPLAPDLLQRIQSTLLRARAPRIRPLRDEKVLLDWNGLMIGALARAGRAFGADHLLDAAAGAHDFARQNLRGPDGWLHRWFEDDAAVPAMLDDYAFMGLGLVELFQATSNPDCLEDALELTGAMLDRCDAPDGGFFRSSTAGEELLVRKQDWYDGAMPAGVSGAMGLLLSLGRLASRPDLIERAARLGRAASAVLSASPGALTGFLSHAVSVWEGPGGNHEVVVVAESGDDPLVKAALSRGKPGGLAFWLPASGPQRDRTDALIPAASQMRLVGGKAAAYVCQDYTCGLPVTDTKSLRDALGIPEA